jgi:hypothetical protein
MNDVDTLIGLFDRLVDAGSTVIVIEHNLDVISRADWVIDLGPGAGQDGGHPVRRHTVRSREGRPFADWAISRQAPRLRRPTHIWRRPGWWRHHILIQVMPTAKISPALGAAVASLSKILRLTQLRCDSAIFRHGYHRVNAAGHGPILEESVGVRRLNSPSALGDAAIFGSSQIVRAKTLFSLRFVPAIHILHTPSLVSGTRGCTRCCDFLTLTRQSDSLKPDPRFGAP